MRENVGARVTGDTGQLTVLAIRCGPSGGVLALAVIGWWERRRPAALGCAALVPFGLVALQSYGGEMLLRAFLYSLPLLCAFAGAALARSLHKGRFGAAAAAALLGVASVALVAARGGNDAYVAFRDEDVAVAQAAYRITAPGERIAALTAYVPFRSARIGEVRQESLERACPPGPAETPCVLEQAPDAVVITRAQDNYGVAMLGLPADWTHSVATDLVAGDYREHLRLGDALLLVRVDSQEGSR